MKLPDMDCILCHVIYVRSKIAVGIANWKHSHSLFFPLGRLAGNMKLKRDKSHISILPFFKKSCSSLLPSWVPSYRTLPSCSANAARCCILGAWSNKGASLSAVSWEMQKVQDREDGCHAHLALAGARRRENIGFQKCTSSAKFCPKCIETAFSLWKGSWLRLPSSWVYNVSCQKVDWCSTQTLPSNERIEWAVRFGNTKKGIGSFFQRKMELLIQDIIQTSCSASIRSIKINYFQSPAMGFCWMPERIQIVYLSTPPGRYITPPYAFNCMG